MIKGLASVPASVPAGVRPRACGITHRHSSSSLFNVAANDDGDLWKGISNASMCL